MAKTIKRERQPGATWPRSNWVVVVQGFLDANPWLYYLGYGAVACFWSSGVMMLMNLEGRGAIAAAGGLIFAGGMVEIFLSRPLAAWRDETPWWLRIFNEGYWGAVDYAPATFRFLGAVGAGVGCGAFTWALWPNPMVAGGMGVAGCLIIWVWTWFAFAEIDE